MVLKFAGIMKEQVNKQTLNIRTKKAAFFFFFW